MRNVATALYLAATLPDAGTAINVLDSEVTTVDAFYRLLAELYLPGKRFRTVTLPRWVGLAPGAVISGISTLGNRAHPLTDPSLYALYTISSNLDFSNRRLLSLFAHAGLHPVTREEGIAELRVITRMENGEWGGYA